MRSPTREHLNLMKKKIKAITFDLDDTFWDIEPVIINAEINTRKWIEKHINQKIDWGNYEDFMALRRSLVEINPSMNYDLGSLRKATIEYHVKPFFDNNESLNKFIDDAFDIFIEARQNVVLYDGVISSLTALAKVFNLGVLTNGNANIKKIGIDRFFKCSISSMDVKSNKPAPKHFEAASSFFNIDMSEILHIGDHPINDVIGAKEAGANAVWFNKNNLSWEHPVEKPIEIKNWLNAVQTIAKNFERKGA